jgi:hypothetical protein
MAIINIDRNPPERLLRSFGFLLAAFVPLFGALVGWRSGRLDLAVAVWVVGGLLTAIYWLAPALRRPIYVGWMYAVFPIGWTISHVLMAAIFYGVVAPIGFGLRLAGRELLPRQFDRSARTYWVPHAKPDHVNRYFRQY